VRLHSAASSGAIAAIIAVAAAVLLIGAGLAAKLHRRRLEAERGLRRESSMREPSAFAELSSSGDEEEGPQGETTNVDSAAAVPTSDVTVSLTSKGKPKQSIVRWDRAGD